MKLRPVAFLPFFAFFSHFALAQGTRPEPPLKISLLSEEPSGVFFDRDTLVPQTPLLFSARIENPSLAPRQVTLSWRITDAAGQIRFSRSSKFQVEGGDSIVRRELFDAPARGGYLLRTVASSRLRGPDTAASASLPFAVTVAPAPNSSAARPRSFFVLNAPATLTGRQLDFYARLGARVLRSPLPADPTKPDWPGVENQLGERLKRNLATIALLPLGEGQSRSSQAFWARQVPATLARYGSLTTWELSGDLSPADLDAWSQLARARRSDISLLGPLPSDLPENLPANTSIRVGGLEGATFGWPTGAVHPAALRRLWLSRAAATQRAGLASFHLRRDAENDAKDAGSREASPGQLTQDYLAAITAGASSMSESVAPPPNLDDDAPQLATAMARGAAFSMLSRTLEDAAFREELFPRSPALEGALFRAPRGSIAVVYVPQGTAQSAAQGVASSEGKMIASVSPARVFDEFGNPIASDNKGRIEIPLSGQPVFVLAEVPTDVLAFALRGAKISGIMPLAAQFLPLSHLPGGDGSTAVRVRLQNIGLGEQSGQIKLLVPSGWKLAVPRYDFRLEEGESKTYEFRATVAPLSPKWAPGRVPLGFSTSGTTKLSVNSEVPIVSALHVAGTEVPRLDGALDDWNQSLWQNAGPNAAGVSARVALKWDEKYLYLAAQVREASLSPRRGDEASYEFWRSHDALQIAFGTLDGPETVPSAAPFRDSNRGFLLSPFGQTGASEFDGRVLKLWGGGLPYNAAPDRVRWGGVVAGSNCVIKRDEKDGLTLYEARLPWSALPEVSPSALAARDGALRWGWLLHNDEGAALDWARGAGSFPWWSNPTTFLPNGELSSPLRATLGFSLAPAEIVKAGAAAKTPSAAPNSTSSSVGASSAASSKSPALIPTLPAPPSSLPVSPSPLTPSTVSPSTISPSVVLPSVVVPPAAPSVVPPASGPLTPLRPALPEIAPFIVPPAPAIMPLLPSSPR